MTIEMPEWYFNVIIGLWGISVLQRIAIWRLDRKIKKQNEELLKLLGHKTQEDELEEALRDSCLSISEVDSILKRSRQQQEGDSDG